MAAPPGLRGSQADGQGKPPGATPGSLRPRHVLPGPLGPPLFSPRPASAEAGGYPRGPGPPAHRPAPSSPRKALAPFSVLPGPLSPEADLAVSPPGLGLCPGVAKSGGGPGPGEGDHPSSPGGLRPGLPLPAGVCRGTSAGVGGSPRDHPARPPPPGLGALRPGAGELWGDGPAPRDP